MSKIEREGEERTTGLENDALLDEQEGRLIYMQAAVLASSSLYSNGDLGGASDGERMGAFVRESKTRVGKERGQ